MMTVYDFEERLFMADKRRVTDDDMAEYRRLTSSVDRDMQLDRKTAALIIHEFLYDVLKEPDEEDISPAFELEDIYECRVCAMHIAQVYSKGIANASHYFDLKRTVSEDEAANLIDRTLIPGKRVKPTGNSLFTTKDTIRPLKADNGEVRSKVIDIGSHAEYELYHEEDSENIPMDELVRNPYSIGNDLKTPITVICDSLSRIEVAIKCLKEAGFKDVSGKYTGRTPEP